MNKYSKLQLIVIILLFALPSAAQSTKNLDVFYSLIDSSLNLLPDPIPGGNSFSIYTGSNNLIYNYLFGKLTARYQKPADTSGVNEGLSYAIEELRLKYGEIFRKKFLGDYYLERNFGIKGNFAVKSTGLYRSFNLTHIDTVKLEDAEKLENSDLPFTKADIPAEPFLEGIPEPVVAIGTAAAAVILFFVLRSK